LQDVGINTAERLHAGGRGGVVIHALCHLVSPDKKPATGLSESARLQPQEKNAPRGG
jgi:hypothetical protein